MTLPHAPDAASGVEAGSEKDSGISSGSSPQRPGARLGRPFPLWLRLSPYVLSAVLFLSAFFSLFSPLPILFQYFRAGRRWAWLALITNAALVFLAGGNGGLALYFVFVIALALPMAELLKKRKSLEAAALAALVTMAVSGAGLGAYFSKTHHVHPWAAVRESVSQNLDRLAKSVQEGHTGKEVAVESGEVEEWKQSLLVELPSAVAVISLVLVWANLLILLRINPGRVRESLRLDAGFFRKWKAPEYLVWPTILAGFFLLVKVPHVSAVAINVFKFVMAIYALQGLSVLSFFFDAWGLRPMFRTLGFLAAVFIMMPLLLSLGFFDLWFDFRAKFRQS